MSDNFAQSTGALGAIMNNMGGKATGTAGLKAAKAERARQKRLIAEEKKGEKGAPKV